MVFMQQHHLQQVTRHVIYVTTSKILLLLFCIWTSYVSLGEYMILILKFYTVSVSLHDVTNFLNHKTFSRKQVSNFYRENMTSFLNYVTATLRALFAWRCSFSLSSFPVYPSHIFHVMTYKVFSGDFILVEGKVRSSSRGQEVKDLMPFSLFG